MNRKVELTILSHINFVHVVHYYLTLLHSLMMMIWT